MMPKRVYITVDDAIYNQLIKRIDELKEKIVETNSLSYLNQRSKVRIIQQINDLIDFNKFLAGLSYETK